MIEKKNNFFLIIIFILLVSSLISAFLIEYGLGHKPCKLCLYQRYPYYISISVVGAFGTLAAMKLAKSQETSAS